MKLQYKLFLILILICIAYFLFQQNNGNQASSVATSDKKVPKLESSGKKKTEPINIRRINTRLADAENNDRDDVLKEFLLAKGIFDGSRSIDISEIKTLTFKELTNSELITVSFLPNLIELNIAGTLVSSIDCLASLENLQHLNISGTSVESLQALKELPLKTLIASDTHALDYKIIGKVKTLEYLDISKCNTNDIKALQNLVNLVHLDISNTKISDLSPLASLPKIKKLIYTNSAVVVNNENIELILRTR